MAVDADTYASIDAAIVSDDVVVSFDLGQPFTFPIRYGANPDPVTILLGAGHLPDLQKLATAGANGQQRVCALRFKGPRRFGRSEEFIEYAREGLLVQSVTSVNERICRIQIVDKRWNLRKRLCPCDFNIPVGFDGGDLVYQEGTTEVSYSACTVEEALGILDRALALVNESYDLKNLVSGNTKRDAQLPDNLLWAGRLTLADAIDTILSFAGLGLTVDGKGDFVVANTSDQFVPNGNYSWAQEPDLQADVAALPESVDIPYIERREIKASTLSYSGTRQPYFGNGPRVFLEQVYNFYGNFMTAAELAADYASNYGQRNGTTASFVADIDRLFNSTNFAGSLIQTASESTDPLDQFAAAGAVEYAAVVRRDYRQLYRLVLDETAEELFANIGNIKFGVFDSVGRVVPFDDSPVRASGFAATVLANYCVFTPYPLSGWVATGYGSPTAKNYGVNAAPFNVRWERTPRERVIRLELANPPMPGSYGKIGNLSNVPRIRLAGANDLVNVDVGAASGANTQLYVEAAQAEMDATYTLEVSMVADVMAPNNFERFYFENRPGFGTGGVHDLGVDESVYACKLNDGTLINADAVRVNADSRADAYLQQFRYSQSGSGLAHSLQLAKDVDHPNGNLVELAIEFSTRGRGFIGTRATWGRPASYRPRSSITTAQRRSYTTDVAGQETRSA